MSLCMSFYSWITAIFALPWVVVFAVPVLTQILVKLSHVQYFARRQHNLYLAF